MSRPVFIALTALALTSLWLSAEPSAAECRPALHVDLSAVQGADEPLRAMATLVFDNESVVKRIFANRANDARTEVLIAAIQMNAAPIVAKLTASGIDVNDRRLHDLVTPLVVATTEGCAELVRMLLDAGADPNAAWGGARPLVLAILLNHESIVCELVKGGADVGTPEVMSAVAFVRNPAIVDLVADPGMSAGGSARCARDR